MMTNYMHVVPLNSSSPKKITAVSLWQCVPNSYETASLYVNVDRSLKQNINFYCMNLLMLIFCRNIIYYYFSVFIYLQ